MLTEKRNLVFILFLQLNRSRESFRSRNLHRRSPVFQVKIFFTAMSKENGRVFDSNIGKVPYKFRLGSKGNTDGWKYGITGMCIGDKRRLIVPPSLGCGEDGVGENVSPNSWLVYEVELVDVHK